MRRRTLVTLAALVLGVALAGPASARDDDPRAPGAEPQRQTGTPTLPTGKEVAESTRRAAREVGRAAKKAAQEVGKAVRDLRRKLAE